MARQGGLGRGITALIPTGDGEQAGETDGVYRQIPIESLRPNQYQPRRDFDEQALDSLTASIAELGVLQPLLVRPVGDGYELVAGERRWRAAERAGLETVPVIVRDVADVDSLAQAVVENIHRHDLHALEEAGAYRQLLDDFGLTHEQLAARMGRSRSAITNTLRLLQLPASIQKLVATGNVSAGHARALLACEDPAEMDRLAKRIVRDGLSVRDVERLASAGPSTTARGETGRPGDRSGSSRPPRPAATLELEQLLSEYLSTGVTVELGTQRGRVLIEFADIEDLERIYRLMHHPSNGR